MGAEGFPFLPPWRDRERQAPPARSCMSRPIHWLDPWPRAGAGVHALAHRRGGTETDGAATAAHHLSSSSSLSSSLTHRTWVRSAAPPPPARSTEVPPRLADRARRAWAMLEKSRQAFWFWFWGCIHFRGAARPPRLTFSFSFARAARRVARTPARPYEQGSRSAQVTAAHQRSRAMNLAKILAGASGLMGGASERATNASLARRLSCLCARALSGPPASRLRRRAGQARPWLCLPWGPVLRDHAPPTARKRERQEGARPPHRAARVRPTTSLLSPLSSLSSLPHNSRHGWRRHAEPVPQVRLRPGR